LIFQALHLKKSQIAGKVVEAQRAARVAELENDNAQLRAERDAARSKLAEVEGCEQALTSTYEEVKKDFNDLSPSHDAVLKEKAETDAKMQRFQDSLHRRLAELRREKEGSKAALGGRSAEFPADASMSDFLGWFRVEIAAMPTAFTECNENITCYALIGGIQMLAGEGCEHVS
jgi:chromosome segregation ATPase